MFEVAAVFVGIFLAQVSPGPNLMAVSSVSLGSGRLPGLTTAAGVATGVFIWAVLFACGIGALLQAVPQTVTAMRFIGGGYLVYLGLKALHAAFTTPASSPVARHREIRAGAAYRRGLLVVMTNPKAALMWVTISMFLASSNLPSLYFLGIGIGAALSAMIVYSTYAVIFSTGVAMRAHARLFRVIEGGYGAVFGGVGAKLIVDGLQGFRAS